MWNPTSSTKCCATCANWAGERVPKPLGVEVPSTSTRGKCYAGVFTSVSSGQCACEGRSCTKYQKWGALR